MAVLSTFALPSITQGTVVDNAQWGDDPNPLSIVLSNACDFENDKLGYVILAALVPASDTIVNSKEFLGKVSSVTEDNIISGSKLKKAIISLLENYIYNKTINRYYFLDPTVVLGCPPLLVDFQRIQSIGYANIKSLEGVAQLDSPYKEEMIMRFVSYTARIPVNRERYNDTLINSLITPYSFGK